MVSSLAREKGDSTLRRRRRRRQRQRRRRQRRRRRRRARCGNCFRNLVRVVAIDFVKKSSKSELSLRFCGRLKISEDFGQKFSGSIFFQKSDVLEDLWFFDPRWQMRRKKLLPEAPLFLGRLSCRGVKDSIRVFGLDLAPKMTSNIWCCDDMIIWYVRRMIRVITLITLFSSNTDG